LRKICQFWKLNPQRTSAVVTICDDDDNDCDNDDRRGGFFGVNIEELGLDLISYRDGTGLCFLTVSVLLLASTPIHP